MAQGTYHFAESMLTHTNWNTKAWYWTDIWSMQLSSLPGAIQDMSAPVSIQRCPNALYGLFSRRNVSWVSSKVLVWGGFQRPKRLQVQWLSSRDVKRRVQATKLWTKWEGVSWGIQEWAEVRVRVGLMRQASIETHGYWVTAGELFSVDPMCLTKVRRTWVGAEWTNQAQVEITVIQTPRSSVCELMPSQQSCASPLVFWT